MLAKRKIGFSVRISGVNRLCEGILSLFGGFGPTGRVRLVRALSGASLDRSRFTRVVKHYHYCRTLPVNCRGSVPGLLVASDRVGDIYHSFCRGRTFKIGSGTVSLFSFRGLLARSGGGDCISACLRQTIGTARVDIKVGGILHKVSSGCR